MTSTYPLYEKIGMALISAQRVEFLTGKLLEHLVEFDKEIYKITSSEFLSRSEKAKNAHRTLGGIFSLLKLNHKLVIENELDDYLKKRNLFVHSFWQTYLSSSKEGDISLANDFCTDFGRHSEKIEKFFKGFIYFLSLRHFQSREQLNDEVKKWNDDFDFFISTLQQKSTINNS